MLAHKTSLSKLKIEIISNTISNLHWCGTRDQLQEENWKIPKYEIKQHASEKPMGQR